MISMPYQSAGVGRDSTADPLFFSNALLLDGIGANGGTSFPDRSRFARTMTANGGVQTSTAHPFRSDATSIAYGGAGDYLTAATAAEIAACSTQPWTVDGWYRTNSATTDQMLMVYAQASIATGAEVLFGLAHFGAALAGKVRGFCLNGTTQFNVDSTTVLAANTDYYISFSCARVATANARTLYLHINGVREATNGGIGSSFNTPASQQLRLGKYETTTTRYLNGYQGRWRLTVGRARYNDSNYVVPKLPPAPY